MQSDAFIQAGAPAHTSAQQDSTSPLRVDARSRELECMTVEELADALEVNRKTVYEYAARGVIPCRRLGRKVILHRATILAWLAGFSMTTARPGRR